MKTLLTTIFLVTISLSCFSQDTDEITNDKKKPKSTYKVGSAQVTVWVNKRNDGTTWKNFKIEKVYKVGDKWKTTNSFTESELLELRAALDKAISEEAVKSK
jgi:predicted HNH restriction endonuclease